MTGNLPQMTTQDDIHAGSLGAHYDNMIGTCPKGAPTGYVLRKLEYEASPPACDTIIASYRFTERHRGTVVSVDSGTVAYKALNGDSADATSAEYAALAPQRLAEGDILVAAILRVIDGRSYDTKSGHFAAGVVPCANPDPQNSTHYGAFAGTASTTIVGNSIGGSVRVACSTVKKNVAIIHVAEDAAWLRRASLSPNAGPVDRATPVMAIVAEGHANADGPKFNVHLTTYALVGARDEDHSHPSRDYSKSLDDFYKIKLNDKAFAE